MVALSGWTARRDELRAAGDLVFELPQTARPGMRVPARVYADETLLAAILEGEAMSQLANIATLPGVVECVYGMPDMHEGYGFPVGGVAATLLPDGVVSPGGVGFDINCGVRLLSVPLTRSELGDRLESFVHELSRSIPSGTGHGSRWRLTDAELNSVLAAGSAHLVHAYGFGIEDDVTNTESGGCLGGSDPAKVSQRAKDRGRTQLGSIGAGNHFVEVQFVERVSDAAVASVFGLAANQVTVLIHTGSRGLGHQVCTDYVKLMDARLATNGIVLPDRQLWCAPAWARCGSLVSRAPSSASSASILMPARAACSAMTTRGSSRRVSRRSDRQATRSKGRSGPTS